MSQKYLTMSRHGVYYFQYWIPKNLKSENFKQKIFRFSLNTTIKREAIKQSNRIISVIYELEDKFCFNPEGFGITLVEMKNKTTQIDKLNQDIANDQRMYTHGLDMMRKLKGIDVESFDEETENYLSQFNQYDMECYELAKKAASKPVTPLPQTAETQTIEPNELISECLELYLNEKRGKNNDKSLDKMKKIISVFIDVVDDKPASHLTKKDAITFKKLLLKLPSNKNKKPQYKNKNFKEILNMEIPDKDILATKTQCGYVKQVSAFLGWMLDNDYNTISNIQAPLKGVFDCGGDDSEDVDAFDDDDLKRLFENDYYFRRKHKTPSKHWVPLIGLFTGARLNEICQLYKEDIGQENGIRYFHFNDDAPDKHIKKSWHNRKIPIHKELIKLGLLDYVESIKTERIFPELVYKEKSYYQKTISDWFRVTYRNKRNCNVGQKEGEKKVFHSFRHTLVTQLLNDHDISPPKIARLVGHKPKDGSITTGVYAKPIKLPYSNKIIQRVKWNIDFSKIRKW